jgi:hypothetical protein
MKHQVIELACVVLIFSAFCCCAETGPIPELLESYEIERIYDLSKPEDLESWCLTGVRGDVVINSAGQGVQIRGHHESEYCIQSGISSCIPDLTTVKRIECAVTFRVETRDTAVVLGLISLDVGCSMLQVRCHSDAWTFDCTTEPCPRPHQYVQEAYRHAWIDGMLSPGTYTLRFTYDSGTKRARGYRDERFIGAEWIRWEPGELEIMVFSESSEDFQGDIDVTILSIALGWDPVNE